MELNLADMKFDNTLGALLVGGLCATALYGVSCVQMQTYFMRESKDKVWFKGMIAFLWALDTFDAALNGHFLYFYMVTNYLNPTAMIRVAWSIIAHVAATAISNFIIRAMFAHRVLILSERNVWLTALIMGVSTTDLVTSLVITAKAAVDSKFVDLESLSNLFYVSFIAGTGSDLLVALSLCFYLGRSRTGFRRTDSLVQSLMNYSINTGLIVAIDATCGLITYIVMPHNFIFICFYLQLSKLYLNAYLASLNARDGLRKTMNEPVSINLSSITGPLPTGNSRTYDNSELARQATRSTEKVQPQTMGISVSTLVDRTIDDFSTRRQIKGA